MITDAGTLVDACQQSQYRRTQYSRVRLIRTAENEQLVSLERIWQVDEGDVTKMRLEIWRIIALPTVSIVLTVFLF